MKKVNLYIFVLLFVNKVFSQNNFGIGIGGSSDFNFYKYSNFKYKDNERINRVSSGYSAGLLLTCKLNKKIELFSNILYSEKKYSPDRTFSFGVLRHVKMNTLDIPFNIKFQNKTWRNLYLIGGLTYQIELYKLASFDFFNGFDKSYDFVKKQNYILPNIGIG